MPKLPAARGPECFILWNFIDLKGEPQSVVSPASRQDTFAVHNMCIAVLIKDPRGIWASVAVAEIISDVVEVVCASASARSRQ